MHGPIVDGSDRVVGLAESIADTKDACGRSTVTLALDRPLVRHPIEALPPGTAGTADDDRLRPGLFPPHAIGTRIGAQAAMGAVPVGHNDQHHLAGRWPHLCRFEILRAAAQNA